MSRLLPAAKARFHLITVLLQLTWTSSPSLIADLSSTRAQPVISRIWERFAPHFTKQVQDGRKPRHRRNSTRADACLLVTASWCCCLRHFPCRGELLPTDPSAKFVHGRPRRFSDHRRRSAVEARHRPCYPAAASLPPQWFQQDSEAMGADGNV